MKKSREFEEILEECLERVIRGDSIEDLLYVYSKYADELEPLLRMAVDAKGAVDIRPRREFRERAGYEFQAALRELPPEKSTGKGFFRRYPVFSTVTAVILAILIIGSGTVVAASDSLPDEPLYVVKTAAETIRLAFTVTDEGKAELYVELADKRVDEIIKMAEKGNVAKIEDTTGRLEDTLVAMSNLDVVDGGAMLQTDEATFEAAEAPLRAPEPAPSAATPPMLTTAPTTTPAPTEPQVEETAPEAALPATMAPESAPGKALDDAAAGINVWEDGLRIKVANSAVENSVALRSLLEEEDLDDDVRQALLQVLDLMAEGYDQVLNR